MSNKRHSETAEVATQLASKEPPKRGGGVSTPDQAARLPRRNRSTSRLMRVDSFPTIPQFQYKRQQFQQDAVNAVSDIFRGVDFTPFLQDSIFALTDGTQHAAVVASISDQVDSQNFLRSNFQDVLESNLHNVQERNGIISTPLIDKPYLALDTQMETGTGKTFTFINTIYELHKEYGLTHFVIIVPSIAIKEGIKKSFKTTAAWFERLYEQRIEVHEMVPIKGKTKHKVPPSGVMNFVYNRHLTVLIMTNHSFNRADNIINQELEGFYADNTSTPIHAIAAKNPVLIIDEPQRVEGPKTIERIARFSPMFVLRYSATFRENQIKNLVYVLDSYDAFNKKLVKGITVTDYKTGATDSAFLGLQRILQKNGQIVAELAVSNATGNSLIITASVDEGSAEGQLYAATENPAYRGLYLTRINKQKGTVTFSDACTLKLGEYLGGEVKNESIIAEVMLRDTINKHLQKEQGLFRQGIKCISLIFIDRVKDYRDYEADDEIGPLQKLFEQCYQECKQKMLKSGVSSEYRDYLNRWTSDEVHGGYFSGDAKNDRSIDEGAANGENDKALRLQQEVSELILRDKEQILRMNNKLRFIFAHSALREGWDNPNIFQICKLRSGYSEIDVVQEIGRGLRICLNQALERQDSETIGAEFLNFNRLDVFTLGNGEFIKRLQMGLSRRRTQNRKDFMVITVERLTSIYNLKQIEAVRLWNDLHEKGYVDEDGYLIAREGLGKAIANAELDPHRLLSKLPSIPYIGDGRSEKSEPRKYRVSQTHYEQFKRLWRLLHQKVVYQVKYSDDFENKVVDRINTMSNAASLYLHRQTDALSTGEGIFSSVKGQESDDGTPLVSNLTAQTFLNQLSKKTHLPRNAIVRILLKVDNNKYAAMQRNPYAAIQRIATVINGVIHQSIIDNIRYIKLDGMRKAEAEITLTDREFTAQHYLELGDLPNYKDNNLWQDIAPYDSEDPEMKISESALADAKITVFAKLPRAVNIPAPLHPQGINPDFAIIVRQGDGNNRFYFIAEAKPTTEVAELRRSEKWRVDFMKKYFEGIEADVEFAVVSNYHQLLDLFNQAGASR